MPKVASVAGRALMELGSCALFHVVAGDDRRDEDRGVIERILSGAHELFFDGLGRQLLSALTARKLGTMPRMRLVCWPVKSPCALLLGDCAGVAVDWEGESISGSAGAGSAGAEAARTAGRGVPASACCAARTAPVLTPTSATRDSPNKGRRLEINFRERNIKGRLIDRSLLSSWRSTMDVLIDALSRTMTRGEIGQRVISGSGSAAAGSGPAAFSALQRRPRRALARRGRAWGLCGRVFGKCRARTPGERRRRYLRR
jgi:hypothetical protein